MTRVVQIINYFIMYCANASTELRIIRLMCGNYQFNFSSLCFPYYIILFIVCRFSEWLSAQ